MSKPPRLLILSEHFQGQKNYELTEGFYSIGRVPERQICIPDKSVSSNHCEIRRNEDGTYSAIDLGSSNGTRINGIRITEQQLNHSDILQIGVIEIMYHSEEDTLNTKSSAQTGINLEDSAGGLKMNQMENVSPLKRGVKKSDGKKANIVMYMIIGVLAIPVVILTIYLILKLLGIA